MIFSEQNFKIIHQGIDTLIIGVNCTDEEYFKNKFSFFVEKIRDLKLSAQAINSYGEKYVLDDLGFPYGNFKISSKGLGQYFGYFSNDDVICVISDTKFKSKTLYHLKIQFRSIFLLKYGHEFCYKKVSEFLNNIFGIHYKVTALRLDICTDTTGHRYTPQDFLKFRSLRRYSNYTDVALLDDDILLNDDDTATNFDDFTRINLNNFSRYSRFEGISFGKTPNMFRIYDKIKQVKDKQISTLIFIKWEMCGFDINRDMFVFRHEVEFGRKALKSMLPINNVDDISYIFSNLGKFWANGLTLCKWYDLTDDEVRRLTESQIQTDSKRLIYFRCDNDDNRLKFWDLLNTWDYENNTILLKHSDIFYPCLDKCKKALKSFISSVYSNLGHDSTNFLKVLEAVKSDLAHEKMTLHDYGLNKLAGNFLINEDTIKKQKLDIENPLYCLAHSALDDFIHSLSTIQSEAQKTYMLKIVDYFKKE